MRYLRALWAAILAFLAALKQETTEDIREARERHDQLQRDTQEAIDAVPDKTDDELTDIAIDTGLVQRPGGAGGTGQNPRAYHTYYSDSDTLPGETDGEPDK